MNKSGFSKVSLRDLNILVSLVEAGRIGPVANKFSMSTSAVSYAVERLRVALDDTLLVRTSHGFRPTEFGRQYAERAKAFLAEMDSLQEQRGFDPAKSERSFTIMATDYELGGFLGEVAQRLLTQGPNLSLRIIETRPTVQLERLFEDIDIIFAPLPLSRAGVSQTPLLRDDYVTFYDSSARAAPDTLEAYCAAAHGVVVDDGTPYSNVDKALAHFGRKRHVQLSVPSFSALSRMMRGTEMVTTLPAKLCTGDFAGFAQCAPPVTLEPLEVFMTYAQLREGDGGFNWLHDMICAQA